MRLHEEWRHKVRKTRGARSMKITIEDGKASNIIAELKRLNTLSKRRETNETESLSFYSFPRYSSTNLFIANI